VALVEQRPHPIARDDGALRPLGREDGEPVCVLPSAPAPVGILSHKQILSLHAAVTSAHITTSRAALLGGIDPAFVDGLPICSSLSSQILSDLHALNAAERLADGAVPFSMWLENGLALVGQRAEAEVFQRALAAAEATDGAARGGVGQGASQRGDEIAEELSRIGRAVLLARSDDLKRCLYEVEALLTRCPHHVEARLLCERVKRSVDEQRRWLEPQRGYRRDRDMFCPAAPLRMQGSPPRDSTPKEPAQNKISASQDTLLVAAGKYAAFLIKPYLKLKSYFVPPPKPRLTGALPSSFLGRQREMFVLQEKIGDGGVVLSGLEGMGKTALARKLADGLTPSYPDLKLTFDLKGTSRAPLSPAAMMADVIHAFLPVIRLPERPEDLAGLYRSVLTGQRALLFLDNARDRDQVAPLLPPPGSALIITSRRRFDLPGVHSLSIDGLESNDARILLRELAPRLDERTAGTIAELCGGLPFALELAGRALSQRLDLSTEAYTDRLRDALTRCSLIDAALSVTFDLLDAVLQALWCRLSVFPSNFSGATVAEHGDLESRMTDEALGDLVAYGMVEHDPVTRRYSLRDSARRFAHSRLSEEDRADAERWCAQKPPQARENREANVTRLSEKGLERALRVARRVGERHAEAYYLAELGSTYASAGGRLRSAFELASQALAILRALGDHDGERRVLSILESLQAHMDYQRRVIESYEQRFASARERGDRREMALASWQIGLSYELLEELDNAIAAMQVSVDLKVESWYADSLLKLRASLKQ
jgi:hypothetical protein